jgi:hypothetical protein
LFIQLLPVSRTTREQGLAQVITDMREECFEALRDHRVRWARVIVVRWYVYLVLTVVALVFSAVLKWVVGIQKLVSRA